MLVCGSAPFQEANDSETLTMIMDCNYIVPSHISQPCQSLISSMLCREPAKRATLDEVRERNNEKQWMWGMAFYVFLPKGPTMTFIVFKKLMAISW